MASTSTTSEKPARRTRMKRADRRAQLLDLAEEMLLEGGAGALTMEGLAARAGIAKTVVYSHFDNASGVIIALLEQHWSEIDQAFAPPPEGQSTSEASIRRIGEAYLGKTSPRRQRLRRLLFRAGQDPEAQAAFQTRQSVRLERSARVIASERGIDLETAKIFVQFLFAGLAALGSQEMASAQRRQRAIDTFVTVALASFDALSSD